MKFITCKFCKCNKRVLIFALNYYIWLCAHTAPLVLQARHCAQLIMHLRGVVCLQRCMSFDFRFVTCNNSLFSAPSWLPRGITCPTLVVHPFTSAAHSNNSHIARHFNAFCARMPAALTTFYFSNLLLNLQLEASTLCCEWPPRSPRFSSYW